MHRGAGDAERLTDPGRGHHVGLDRGFEPLDGDPLLHPLDGFGQPLLVDRPTAICS